MCVSSDIKHKQYSIHVEYHSDLPNRVIHWTGHFPRAALTAPTWGAAATCVLQHRLPGLGNWGNRCRETPSQSSAMYDTSWLFMCWGSSTMYDTSTMYV